MLNTFLNLTTMKKITNKYINIAKHKAELTSSVPNSILYYHRLYSLRTVEDLQVQQNISLLHNLVNSSNEFNTIFKSRIQQLQEAAVTNISILKQDLHIFAAPENNTTIAKRIYQMHSLHCSFTNRLSNWPQELQKTRHSINKIIKMLPNIILIKKRLNKIGLYFIEQMLNYDNISTLPWSLLPHTTHNIPRGKELK